MVGIELDCQEWHVITKQFFLSQKTKAIKDWISSVFFLTTLGFIVTFVRESHAHINRKP